MKWKTDLNKFRTNSEFSISFTGVRASSLIQNKASNLRIISEKYLGLSFEGSFLTKLNPVFNYFSAP